MVGCCRAVICRLDVGSLESCKGIIGGAGGAGRWGLWRFVSSFCSPDGFHEVVLHEFGGRYGPDEAEAAPWERYGWASPACWGLLMPVGVRHSPMIARDPEVCLVISPTQENGTVFPTLGR